MSHPNLQPKIGIVSGIGPLAGSDVLAKLFKQAALIYGAIEDCEYPDVVLLNHGIAGIDNTGNLSDAFEKEIVTMVQQLESQGANIIGIACNTAHVYINHIKLKPETVLVNLIDSVAIEASEASSKHLLLTSAVSKQQKLYQSYLAKHDVSFKQTNLNQQALLDTAIGQVMAHKLEAAGESLEKVLKSAYEAGFTSVIAGCTELPIAINYCKEVYGLTVIDSNELLAQTLLKHYYHLKGGHHA